MKLPYNWSTMLPANIINYLIKKKQGQVGVSSFWVVGQQCPIKSPKHYRLLPLLLFRTWWYDPIAKDSNPLIHRTQRNLAGTDLEASTLQHFTVFEGSMQGTEGEKPINTLAQVWTLPTTEMTDLVRYSHQCNSRMKVMGATNHLLIGFKAWSTR